MLGQDFLLYRQRPTTKQVLAAWWAAGLFQVVFLVVFPFRDVRFPQFNGYVPAIESLMLLGDIITAALLFLQASATRSVALLALAAGYLFSSFTVVPHILTFPGAFGPSGIPGVGVSTSAWLFFSWRIAVPLGVIAYALLGKRQWRIEGEASQYVIAQCVAGVTLLALAATALIMKGQSVFPDLMSDESHFKLALSTIVCLAMAGLSIAAMAMVWRRYGSILDLWLLLMLWVAFLEYCLNASISGRFSLGWYVLKAFGCVSSLLVLVLLLFQTNKLYFKLIAMTSAQERERQRQLLVRDAIAASIAHEMRQPLAAISLNVATALQLPPGDIGVSEIMRDIQNDSNRAIDMVSSTRELYKKSSGTNRPSNVNQLIRETLAMDRRDIQSRGVTVELALAESLPDIVINRLQIQQVLMNLFMNAVEAMSANIGPRVLRVRSEVRGDRLVISVQDTGPGIDVVDQERIFAPFFTTKDTGTGLGLVICQSVVEAHGGTLRAVHRSEPGALFEIALACEGAAIIEVARDEPLGQT